jgi:hypothetical protein
VLLAEINFSDMIWSILLVFYFVIVLWMVFGIIGDIFRSDDLSGGLKAVWLIALLLVPWLTIFIYLLARGSGMSRRTLQKNAEAQAQFRYLRARGRRFDGRRRRRDQERQRAPRQRRHQPRRVRAHQGPSARHAVIDHAEHRWATSPAMSAHGTGTQP